MDIACITIDCGDPARLVEFWSAALGWTTTHVAPDGGGAVCLPPESGTYLEFIRVPEPKSAKNRLHLGCNAGTLAGFDAEYERLVGLGATLAWREVFGDDVDEHYRNWILLDPEGNEFCFGGGTWPDGVPMPSEVPIRRPE